MKSMWIRIESTSYGVWYPQQNIEELSPQQKHRLHRSGWKPLPVPHSKYLYCLMGQLLPLYQIKNKSGSIDFWARESDILHVHTFPVVLASPPLNTQIDLGTTFHVLEQSSSVPYFAKVGLILAGSSAISYPLDLLGEEGIPSWKHVVERIDNFTNASDSYEQWIRFTEEAREDIQQLVALYWQAYQRCKPGRRSLPEILNIFRMRAYAPVPMLLPVRAVFAAYSNAASGGTKWKGSELDGYPLYRYKHSEAIIEIEIHSTTPVKVNEMTIGSLWEDVSRLGDLDSDVFLAALAHAVNSPKDAEGYIWITASQILDYRAVKPIKSRRNGNGPRQRHGHRSEDYTAIAACFIRLIHTWVRTKAPGELLRGEGERTMKKYYPDGSLLEVDDIIYQHELRASTASKLIDTPRAIAWHYRLGSWYRDVTDTLQRPIAWISQQALHYDPHNQQWEKRLAHYFHCCLSTVEGGTIICTIGTLIDELSLPINQRDPEKTRKRFERAMQNLEDDYQVESWMLEPNNEALPSRQQWLRTWLTWRVHITVPSLHRSELA